MKIIVVGLGSMGKRRIRLLKQYFPFVQISGADKNQERREYSQKEYGITAYNSLEEAVREEFFDCAFVCTSPLSHNVIIGQCLNYGMHVFTELNLTTDGYIENMRLAAEKNLKLFLSSTMLYRKEIQYLYKSIKDGVEPLSYNYHVGQYLPDWHPWESYQDFFVGDKRTNGCREILAIELPWIIKVFGNVQTLKVLRSKMSKLKIDYEDCYMILLSHENGNTGMLMVDVISREAVRSLKIIGEHTFLSWEGTPESFVFKNVQDKCMEKITLYEDIQEKGKNNKTIIEDQYINELKQFLGELLYGTPSLYSFNEDWETLNIIDRIEKE